MIYAKEFFHLNLQFAQKMADVLQQPLEQALLDYTHLYLRLGLGRSFDPNHPTWQAYLAELQRNSDWTAWTYNFYRQQQKQAPPKIPMSSVGCFSYALWSDHRVRIHFHNSEHGDESPLGKVRLSTRMSELTALFTHLKPLVPPAATVVGGSWLYNIEAYRRLFPPAYLESAQVGPDEFQFIALWGQFVDRYGRVRENLADAFLACLQYQTTSAGLIGCFPFQVLRLESPIEDFYAFDDIA